MKQLLLLTAFFIGITLSAQSPRLHILENPDTINKKRLYISAGGGLAIYSGFSIALWNSWYKQSEITGFHTFDDAKEWEQMDKAGHFYTAWLESHYVYQGAKWTGMKRKNALITAAAAGIGLQTTIEIMDGFSADWGFSWTDMAANGLGTGFWLAQELIWEEQRFKMKFSASPQSYSTAPIASEDGSSTSSLNERAIELYGDSFGTQFSKITMRKRLGFRAIFILFYRIEVHQNSQNGSTSPSGMVRIIYTAASPTHGKRTMVQSMF